MEKLIVTPYLNEVNKKYRKRILIVTVPLLIIWLSAYLITGNLYTDYLYFFIGITIGSLLSMLFYGRSEKKTPRLEIDEQQIKAYQPKDSGYKEEHFELRADEISGVDFQLNLIALKTQTGEVREIQTGRFEYSDIQKLKKYFTDLRNRLEKPTETAA